MWPDRILSMKVSTFIEMSGEYVAICVLVVLISFSFDGLRCAIYCCHISLEIILVVYLAPRKVKSFSVRKSKDYMIRALIRL